MFSAFRTCRFVLGDRPMLVRPFPRTPIHGRSRVLWPLLTPCGSAPQSPAGSVRQRRTTRKASPGKMPNPRIPQPPHLPIRLPCNVGLRGTLTSRPGGWALYAVSVRWLGTLPPTSFRFRLTTDTLVFGLQFPLQSLRGVLHPPGFRPMLGTQGFAGRVSPSGFFLNLRGRSSWG